MRSLAWGTKDKVYYCINEKNDVSFKQPVHKSAFVTSHWGPGFPFMLRLGPHWSLRGLFPVISLIRHSYCSVLKSGYISRAGPYSPPLLQYLQREHLEMKKTISRTDQYPVVEDRWRQWVGSRINKTKQKKQIWGTAEHSTAGFLNPAGVARLFTLMLRARRVNSRKCIRVYTWT